MPGEGRPGDGVRRGSADHDAAPPAAHPRRETAAAAGRGLLRGGKAVGRVTARAGKGTVRMARRASEAQGAGETGLHRLIQVHAFSSAGDTAVMVGLAGTLFFQVPQGQAKSQVLLFLLLTMLPFAIVAPLIGPLLDRFRHGRRWSIGATLALRAFLCWVLAGSITEQSTWQFPAALGVLVASKAYLVTRSSATPRLLPDQLTLVKANGRLSLAGTVGAGIGGGLAGLAAQLGAEWALKVGFVLFVIGTILAVLLSPRVDSAQGEQQASMRDLVDESEGGQRRGISGSLVTALRANAGLRWLSGFLTIYLAFLLREHPFPGWEDKGTLLLALVIGAAGVGNAIGTMTGALVRTSTPKVIVLATLLADAIVAVVTAARFNVYTAVALALVAGIGQQMGKLALDALIQDTVAERIRTSVFARSETLLQLSWVLGGLVGVLLPTTALLGMTTAAVLLVLWSVAVVIWNSGHHIPGPRVGRRRRAGEVSGERARPGRSWRTTRTTVWRTAGWGRSPRSPRRAGAPRRVACRRRPPRDPPGAAAARPRGLSHRGVRRPRPRWRRGAVRRRGDHPVAAPRRVVAAPAPLRRPRRRRPPRPLAQPLRRRALTRRLHFVRQRTI
ncbi:MFS transporter [Barrientosiimonas endolithica]|uniref:MFS transporter n=1 Tax=Barrientosiimonas endolithica TaxID=1535208 RepID=A0ABM8HA57_9MICO|nr:MFS transporter [Barrientosiimonas endolithica]BDZ57812.1 hypothetical protein GCM10025872_14690 [Barrientosiimonas endolithica]